MMLDRIAQEILDTEFRYDEENNLHPLSDFMTKAQAEDCARRISEIVEEVLIDRISKAAHYWLNREAEELEGHGRVNPRYSCIVSGLSEAQRIISTHT